LLFSLLSLYTAAIACNIPLGGEEETVTSTREQVGTSQPAPEPSEEETVPPPQATNTVGIVEGVVTLEHPGSRGFCDPLPPSTGNIIHIDPSQAGSLAGIAAGVEPGDTLLFADGTYELHGDYLWIDTPGVTIRSASGNREAVILEGNYETAEAISVAASDVTIADLTIRRVETHPIHVIPGEGGNTENTLIYNLHIIDPGQQAIKINANESRSLFADYGTVACSRIELTDAGRPRIWEINGSCYTGGVDGHQAMGWEVRDNLIEGFWCENDIAEHAIHFWKGSRGTVIERNLLVNNARGVGLGLGEGDEMRVYGDGVCSNVGYVGHFEGIVRNNVVFADHGRLFSSEFGFDCGICLDQACEAQVVHNTVVSTQAPFSSIEWRFPNTNVEIFNNLVSHNLRERDGGVASLEGNLEGAPLTIFVDPENGNLHLVPGADMVLDQGIALAEGLCDQDIEGTPRPVGPAPDIGAYEFK
jgi:hypothetical protein